MYDTFSGEDKGGSRSLQLYVWGSSSPFESRNLLPVIYAVNTLLSWDILSLIRKHFVINR